jgi:hypothetical protein
MDHGADALHGSLDLSLALCITPDEELDKWPKTNFPSQFGSHLLHETTHLYSVVGTDFYSEYVLTALLDGLEAANERHLKPVAMLLEAAPTAIRVLGAGPLSYGTGTRSGRGKVLANKLLNASAAYNDFTEFIHYPDCSQLEETFGLDSRMVMRRTVVVGITRALVDMFALASKHQCAPPEPESILDDFILRLSLYSEDTLPRPEESIFEHIDRMLRAAGSAKRRLSKVEQLRQALRGDPQIVISHMHLLPALLGMEYGIHDNPKMRYANWFDSAHPDPWRLGIAVERWLKRTSNPFKIRSHLAQMYPLIYCFCPLMIDGKPVKVVLPDKPSEAYELTCSLLDLQIREFFRRFSKFLVYMLGEQHRILEQLALSPDAHCHSYLQRIEKSVAAHRNTIPVPFDARSGRINLVPGTNADRQEFLKLELI